MAKIVTLNTNLKEIEIIHRLFLIITMYSQCLFGPKKFFFHYWFAPKRHKLQKTIKIEQKMSKNPCFLKHFQIFFNLGAILAQQTSTCMLSVSRSICWHPWDLGERINSGDTRVLRFDLIFFCAGGATWRIFHFH